MPKLIADEGTKREKLVVIGEAPGRNEDVTGSPFSGASWYQRLKPWFEQNGLNRKSAYWTNVYPHRPPNNNIYAIAPNDILYYAERLHERLAALEDPIVIVPTGNTALKALTGQGRWPWEYKDIHGRVIPGIEAHRGSIYEYTDLNGRKIKVIPTIHPAATFRQYRLTKHCELDWRRIAGDLEFREFRLPEREYFTCPNLDDIKWYLREVDIAYNNSLQQQAMSIDIETPNKNLSCVGFSFDPKFGFTIPTTMSYWGSRKQQLQALMLIKALCEHPINKVLQNGLFDLYWLAGRDLNIHVENYKWDLLTLHHVIDPGDDHDLAYLCSVYTRNPYYKDEAKDPNEVRKYANNFEALMTYNAMDNCVQREVFNGLFAELDENGLLPFYERHYASLFYPLHRVMCGGINTDEKERRTQWQTLRVDCVKLQDKLKELTGVELYGPKSLSGAKVAKYLYETLKLPKQLRIRKKAGEKVKSVSVDEVAIRRLMNQFPKRLNEVGKLILDHRRKMQLSTFFNKERVDSDGYYRSTYSLNTEIGRLSSSANPMGTGSNAQNLDREARGMFVADNGHILIEIDGSQVESKICYVKTGDKELIRRAMLPPWEYDDHRFNATIIFGCKESEVTKEQRYFAKRVVHGSQRGLMGAKMADELLKDGYVRTAEECQRNLDTYMDQTPAIRDWHRKIRQKVMMYRSLSNSWGRVIEFRWDRLDDELYRRGYSFSLASECADWLNQWGFIPLDLALQTYQNEEHPPRIVAQVHDSLLVSTPPKYAYAIALLLKLSLERPRKYSGTELVIPIEVKIGKSWGKMFEYKRFPSEKEFTEKAYELLKNDAL